MMGVAKLELTPSELMSGSIPRFHADDFLSDIYLPIVPSPQLRRMDERHRKRCPFASRRALVSSYIATVLYDVDQHPIQQG